MSQGEPRAIPSAELAAFLPTLSAAISQLQAEARRRRNFFEMEDAETLINIVGGLKALEARLKREMRR